MSRVKQTTARDLAGETQSGSRGWLNAWPGLRPWLAVAGAVAIIVAGLAAWTVLQSTRRLSEGQQTERSTGSPTALVTLWMTVGAGHRSPGAGATTTLEIPAGTDTVRLALTLHERDYGRYRVIVRAIGGEEIVQRGDLRPSFEPSGPAFTIDVPAAVFASGDYALALQGATGTGEFDDLSQSQFRVVER